MVAHPPLVALHRTTPFLRRGAFAIAILVGTLLPLGCGTDGGIDSEPIDVGTGGFAIGAGPASGGSVVSGSGGAGGASVGGNVAMGGNVASGGTTSAGGVPTSGAGGMPSAGGAAVGNGGTGGAFTTGGAAGTTGDGGATSTGGVTSTGGTSSTGGASSGSGGKACHSTDDWTPKSGDLWISPSGNDSNDGSESNPKKNLTSAVSAWSSGKTIWVEPGTYSHGSPITLSKSASSSGPLRISGLTSGAKPVFDFSSESRATTTNGGQRGFQVSGNYVHLRYLEIKKAADNCVYVTGSNNTLEWLSVHECQDTGVQLSNGAASNKVLNVDSYLSADPTGENADGFAPKLSIGQNNYFCGTRSYQNSDDGYDCWSAGDNSPVTFEYCWAFGQPGPTGTSQSDGNGFKLGSPSTLASGGNAPHKLISCFSFDNRGSGFTANGNNSGQITCTNCGVWGNGTSWSAGTGGVVPQHTGDITNLNVSVDKAMNAARDGSGDLPDITRL